MGIARGTNIVRDGLVFGYDTGYGVADNNTATRFYPGKPTTNLLSSPEAFDDTNYWARSRNSGSVPTVTANTSPNPLGGTYTSRADKVYIPDDGTYPRIAQNFTPASTNTHTFSMWIRSLSGDCRIYLIAFRNSPWNASGAAHKNLTSEWQRVSFSFTPLDASSHQIYMGAHDDAADKGNTLEFWGAHMEENPEATPYEASSRSNTTSLIDLKRNIDIDVSSVSFDSTGQPTFDGSDDRGVVENFPHVWDSSVSMECIIKFEDSNRSIIFGNYNVGANDVNFEKLTVGNLRFYWNRGERDVTTSNNVVTQDGSKYHHCVFVRDTTNNNFKFYVDGVLVNTVSNAGTNLSEGSMPTNHNKFRIGADTRTGSTVHNGEIPIIKVYNKALSATEVTQNYKAYKNRFNL